MSNEERFWKASIDQITDGYFYDEETAAYECLICHERFENGEVFQQEGRFYEAKKAIVHHITDQHDSMFEYLLSMDKKYTGLSEHQKELLVFFKQGLNDKEIVKEFNGGSPSTIRSHRFKFKEKEKQAKVFLSMMNLLRADKQKSSNDFVPFHKGAKMVDERYATTVKEKDKVLTTYFKQGLDGPLDSFPSKEKRKIIVLQHLMNRFEGNKIYSEKEVNVILKSVHPDFATIRRYLIEYGFMERSKDCNEYWVKN
ncbi:transcriptional regulator [Salipaludibacillus keqinensis]|uniref:Transcriptional regulator n=1 Tax=Salipaludibacillus keqinensis TaxID=2045207 RepID=A0A323TYL8_9BACI|nr:DUF2087 domain-containing protein [Salipaludibacillus keqinensis]PYZ94655.1 transcriptional regulator [Salipaludibacillus keqinensis]